MANQSNPSTNGEYYYFNYRKTLHDPIQAKTCYFYKDNDYKTPAAKVAIHPKRYRKFDNLLSELTRLVPALPFGVRSVYTPRGRSHIYNTDSLMHEGRYICSTHSRFARGVDVTRVQPPETWHVAKPPSGQKALNHLLKEEADDLTRAKRRRLARSGHVYSGRRPKKIQLIRNGEPDFKHSMLLNRKTAQTFDQVMADMSEMFGFAIRKLYTVDGRRINNLNQLFHGPDLLFVAGSESFKAMTGFMYAPMPPSARSVRENVASKHQARRNKMIRTRGKWRVSLTTGNEQSAGTTANVSLTVYGQKGSFGPHELGNNEDGQYFEGGSTDNFEISAPGIGEIYKIRIGHDDSGPDPSWYCDEVRLTDVDTGEELVFPCRKWMDSESGDRETCREIPVKRRGEPTLPVVVYEAKVVTGDLWNAGTDANIYMTIYGDRGDTGTRKLIPPKQNSFQQGKTDTFHIEAVSLGRLKRIIVGHDGTEPGNGWYLERIIVNDPIKNEDFNFYCGRWLDEGEDDMKIVREIQVQEEYMGDILEKRNWDMEKWKFDSKNQIKLISELTGKCLRIKGDGTVDANGDIKEEWVVFNVTARKNMVRSLSSVLNKGYNLAIDNGRTIGNGKGGAYSDFRIHVQHDSTILLESVKYPLQFLTLLDNGRIADPRSEVDNESSRIFYVYCKGMFRNRGVIMLKTSKAQTLAQDSEEGIYGTGKMNRTAHFKIHKVSEKGVRMFESLINPGRFLRFYNGTFDCQGGKDESSHFIITKYPERGYVTIESASERGVFMGLTPTGEVVPSEDTGEKNVCFYPEVIEFGIPKRRNLDYDDDGDDYQSMSHRTPRTPKTPKTPRSNRMEDDMWKITVSTSESMKNGEVSLVAYGDKGNTGPITLAAPVKSGHIFQSGSVDEFTANLSKAGKLFKVRLELEAKSKNTDALWKVRQVKMEDLKTRDIVSLNFNRWLSPIHDDGSTARELPVKQDDEDPLPVLTYMVAVHTGKEKGAATDANVYINLFGENGDCGKRWLNQSNKSKKFQAGQVDVFEVEAVHLGRVSRCLVGHDGTGPGDGWFLDHVVVKESENSKTEFVFPCKKWLDSSKDDRRIERMLPVSDEAAGTVSDQSVHKSKSPSKKLVESERKLSVSNSQSVSPSQSFVLENNRSPRPTSVKVNSRNAMRRRSKNGHGGELNRTMSLSPASPTEIPSKYSVLPPITSSEQNNTNSKDVDGDNGSEPKSDNFQELGSIEEEEEEEEEEIVLPVSDDGTETSLTEQKQPNVQEERLDINKESPANSNVHKIEDVQSEENDSKDQQKFDSEERLEPNREEEEEKPKEEGEVGGVTSVGEQSEQLVTEKTSSNDRLPPIGQSPDNLQEETSPRVETEQEEEATKEQLNKPDDSDNPNDQVKKDLNDNVEEPNTEKENHSLDSEKSVEKNDDADDEHVDVNQPTSINENIVVSRDNTKVIGDEHKETDVDHKIIDNSGIEEDREDEVKIKDTEDIDNPTQDNSDNIEEREVIEKTDGKEGGNPEEETDDGLVTRKDDEIGQREDSEDKNNLTENNTKDDVDLEEEKPNEDKIIQESVDEANVIDKETEDKPDDDKIKHVEENVGNIESDEQNKNTPETLHYDSQLQKVDNEADKDNETQEENKDEGTEKEVQDDKNSEEQVDSKIEENDIVNDKNDKENADQLN